jgi:hypothetical protein
VFIGNSVEYPLAIWRHPIDLTGDAFEGYVSERGQDKLFRRVPHAFAYAVQGTKKPFACVSVHLHPKDGDARKKEVVELLKLVDQYTDKPR